MKEKTKENKIIKISLSSAIILISMIITLITGSTFIILHNRNIESRFNTNIENAEQITDNIVNIKNYGLVAKTSYLGEYEMHSGFRELTKHNFYKEFQLISNNDVRYNIINYEQYKEFCNKINVIPKYTDTSLNFIFLENNGTLSLFDVKNFDGKVVLYYASGYSGSIGLEQETNIIIIPSNEEINSINLYTASHLKAYRCEMSEIYKTYNLINYVLLIVLIYTVIIAVKVYINSIKNKIKKNASTDDEQQKLIKEEIIKHSKILIVLIIIIIPILIFGFKVRNSVSNSNPGTIADKPIIYLYPEEDTNISVKLSNKERITCSYPKYTDGWDVVASSDGTLTDRTTGRKLYSLYYESKNAVDFSITNEGFVIKGEDSAKFLEEKLEKLGLNEREAEEFIIYWLPKLEENRYNYIRFATEEEINANMPLEINPNPDTTIRILMTYKELDKPIEVEEQNLVTPKREGFVVVEWGGTEIK